MPDWIRHLRAGDVVRMPSGVLRVVRKVTMGKRGVIRSATFSIKRCSWTGRCYTVIHRSVLMQGWSHTGRRVVLNSVLDAQIAHDVTHTDYRTLQLHCCDVKGVA